MTRVILTLDNYQYALTPAWIQRRLLPAQLGHFQAWAPVDPADAPDVVREVHAVLQAHTGVTQP